MVEKKLKLTKWRIRIAIALFLYTVIGFFVVPPIIKWQMLKRLPALTKRQVAVAQVRVNPYVLSLTVRGFALTEPNGDPFCGFDELYVNFQLSSVFMRCFVFKEIKLVKPVGNIVYREDGTFNFANLISNSAPKTNQAPMSLPRVLIYDLTVTNGSVGFTDQTLKPAFNTEFVPINLHFTDLTTIRDKNSPYGFVAHTGEGEVFAWSGDVTVNPLRSAGSFRVGGLPLPKYSPYAQEYSRFRITGGKLDVAADYSYDSVTNPLNGVVSNAFVELTGLEIKAPDTNETVLMIPKVTVTGGEAHVVDKVARVASVKSSGGFLLARQNHDGSLNLLSGVNLAALKSSETVKRAVTYVKPWSVKVDEVAFDNYSLQVEDRKPATAASFKIDQLGFTLKNVSTQTNAPVTASASLRFQDTGLIAVNGTATILPPSADLNVTVTNLDLRAAQPYVSEQVKLLITGGTLDVAGRARYASPEPNAPLAGFTGDVAVNKFATTDDVLFKDFIRWDALTVGGINLGLLPDKLHVDEVEINGLETSLVVGPDRRPNLQTILQNQIATKKSATPATHSEAAAESPLQEADLSLGALVLQNAAIHYSDQSLEPHCTFDVQQFNGTIKGLSSRQDTTATVDVNGKVDDRSPFTVTGKVNPLAKKMFADVTVTFTNTELTPFTPYSEKYAGRPLEKGKLSFAVHYLLDDQDVKGENGFYVDQLTLGAKNNSPDATSLPVKLGIALLKDRNGRIQLNVPIAGRINDPKFRLAPIIWQVVVNLLVKAATSPFSLLGAAFGGGEEMSYVDFAPGQAIIADTQTNKLNTLAKALYERPNVSLEINGSTAPAQDRPALALLKFDDQIKSLWLKEQTDDGKPAVPLADIKLDAKAYERLVRKIYKKTFGNSHLIAEVAPTNTVAGTNSATGASAGRSGTNPPAAAQKQSALWEHGSALLMGSRNPTNTTEAIAARTLASNTQIPPAAAATAEPEIEAMAAQLVKKIDVTDDDLRDLMRARANTVQSYLLGTQKVTPDRLFITAPKPISASSPGADRVNLSLD